VPRELFSLLRLNDPLAVLANRLVELVKGDPVLQRVSRPLVRRAVPTDDPVAKPSLEDADVAGDVPEATDKLHGGRHGDQWRAVVDREGDGHARRLVRWVVPPED